MKKGLMLLTLLISLIIPSCGPNEAELRAELQSIDQEMMALRNAAYHHQSQMNQAEFAAFIGSFATGYGITSGEGDLAGEGISTVINADSNYDVASYSLEQIKSRQNELLKRRVVILSKLEVSTLMKRLVVWVFQHSYGLRYRAHPPHEPTSCPVILESASLDR